MPNIWDADFEVTEGLVRRLMEEQFPELAEEAIEPLSHGWDNEAFLVGSLVFRFPRRKIAVKLIEREVRILPLLAPHLPAPVPVSTYLGRQTDYYPSPWAGYPMLAGEVGGKTEPTRELAFEVAGFLRQLHSIPVDADTRSWAPDDDIHRTDLQARLPKLSARLEMVDEAHLIARVEKAAQAAPWANAGVWVHGDFYPSHLLIDNGRLSGVIDWGDVHLGDPALDLSIAFMFLTPEQHDDFFNTYGPVDLGTYERAVFRAVHYGAMFKEYGAAEGIERFTRMGERTLQTIARL